MGQETKGNLISIGGPSEHVKVTLHVFGDDLDPDEITRRIGCAPTKAFRKGEVESKSGARRLRVAKTGKWFLGIESSDELETVVESLFAQLTLDLDVWKDLVSRYKVDVFCGVFFDVGRLNGGFSLSPKVIHMLDERGLEIGFDIYW
ncbi:MAG: DUF4279 domain-containing protein [Anaerolineae bacterium]